MLNPSANGQTADLCPIAGLFAGRRRRLLESLSQWEREGKMFSGFQLVFSYERSNELNKILYAYPLDSG